MLGLVPDRGFCCMLVMYTCVSRTLHDRQTREYALIIAFLLRRKNVNWLIWWGLVCPSLCSAKQNIDVYQTSASQAQDIQHGRLPYVQSHTCLVNPNGCWRDCSGCMFLVCLFLFLWLCSPGRKIVSDAVSTCCMCTARAVPIPFWFCCSEIGSYI